MGWKNWPAWLKGGIICLFLYGAITLILLPFGYPSGCQWLCFPYWIIPTFIGSGLISYPFSMLTGSDLWDEFGLIGAIVFYFIIGAIIGWIVGKVKNRNKPKISNQNI